jgi:hypothetical protein
MKKTFHPVFCGSTLCTVEMKMAKRQTTCNWVGQSIAPPGRGPKLYLVTSARNIVYVGITRQSLSARLRYGFSADGKNGYHGYRWAKSNGRYYVYCWAFDDKVADKELETIEGEIVYLLRESTGQWPKHQTEIHFHTSKEYHRKVAALILEESKKRTG